MKILVVDDHALIREALGGVLKQLKHDADILEASNCLQAMQVVEAHVDLNLVVLDLTLPDGDGFSMLSALRERRPAMAVVVPLGGSRPRDRPTGARLRGAGVHHEISHP